MYLHEDKELFKDIIEQVSNEMGRTLIVVEKDYYVTFDEHIGESRRKKLKNIVLKD